MHHLRLTWKSSSSAYRVSFWMKNITDEETFNGAVDLTNSFGVGSIRPAPPRMWGFELEYRFH